MRSTTTVLAIAALAAFLSAPAAAQDTTRIPVHVACKDGKPVSITAVMADGGIFTLHLPPDVCAVVEEKKSAPARPPRPSASSTRSSRSTAI